MEAFDLATAFVHLRDGGDAEPVQVGPAFFREASARGRYDRLVGVFDFRSAADLHSAMQEMHPEADELIYLVCGAIDVVLDQEGVERSVALEEGHAAIVPRGVWHRLVMRRPGRLLFVNSRSGMQSRKAREGRQP
jgi:mannose-6-phosphate isomerase-like protein (cupin superfamily)